MAIEDLDLEFEDEEQESKGDALDVDVDLSFSAYPVEQMLEQASGGQNIAKKRPIPKAAPRPKPQPQAQPNTNNRPVANKPAPQAKSANTQQVTGAVAKANQQSANNIRNINDAQRANQVSTQAKPVTQVQPDYTNHSHEDIALLREEIELLKTQVQHIEHQAEIKVAVAQAERDYLVEYVSNAKIMDHQVTQILSRVHKKAPALAQEIQLIKKYLSEFIEKSKPGKKGGGN